jgi:hypothetical protein
MWLFLWVLAAMGVGYFARMHGRNPAFWFVLSLCISPLGGSVALMVADRYGW